MKAAVLYELNTPLRIEELEPPRLLPGQVLVQIAYSGVCNSQLMEARGKRGHDHYLPHLLGHEGAGTVLAVGEGVMKVKPGDDVILGWIKGSGIDAPCPVYNKGAVTINAGKVTTFSTCTIASENRCYLMPEGIPADIAVLFGCALPTGAGIVVNQICPKAGSTVAVFGLGGIGLSALMSLQLYADLTVFAIDTEERKLNLAKKFGAAYAINASLHDPVKALLELTCGKGVDYSIDATGTTSGIEMAHASVRSFGGLCVFASHPPSGQKIAIDPHHLISGKRLEGSWGGASDPDIDIPKFAELYRSGKLPLELLLDKTYSLDQINLALSDLEEKKIVRALVDMSL